MKQAPCGTCRYWEILSNRSSEPEGRCRIGPPVLVADRGVTTNVRGTWPIVYIDDWCGQHKPAVVWGATRDRSEANKKMNQELSDEVEKLTKRQRRPRL